jgi:RNA polymerase sigma-70 factor (ECF subfamily)
MPDLETLALSVPVGDNSLPGVIGLRNRNAAMGQADDQDLSQLIKDGVRGNSSALEALYNRFKVPLYNLAYRYTRNAAAAEDILQETFIKVFTHLGDIDRAETFPAWVYRVGVNASLSYLRSRKRELQTTVPLDDVEGRREAASLDPDMSHLRRPIEEAVNSLSEKLRGVFILHDIQGFKHEEIARTLGCSVGTSKSQLFKARRKIRQYLKTKSIERA